MGSVTNSVARMAAIQQRNTAQAEMIRAHNDKSALLAKSGPGSNIDSVARQENAIDCRAEHASTNAQLAGAHLQSLQRAALCEKPKIDYCA